MTEVNACGMVAPTRYALCHTEVASLANPYRSAATSPVSRWPEAIRLGYRSCHMALSNLWNVAGSISGRNPVKLEPIAVDSDGDWHQSDGERLEVTQVEPSAPSEASTGSDQGSESMVIDLQPGGSEAMFDHGMWHCQSCRN